MWTFRSPPSGGGTCCIRPAGRAGRGVETEPASVDTRRVTGERNRTEERTLTQERNRRPNGSGLLSTIATVVILAGAGMAGASQSNGGHGAGQAKVGITGDPGSPPHGPPGGGPGGPVPRGPPADRPPPGA